MATLTVNGVEVRVVGHHDATLPSFGVVPCIEAAILIPGNVRSMSFDGTGLHVRLVCDDGRIFEGNDLWRVGEWEIDGSGRTFVTYQGVDVHEV